MLSSSELLRPGRAPIFLAFVALVSAPACSSESPSAKPQPVPAETITPTAHARGLANANAMVDNARLCEPESGPPSLAACKRACELNHSNSCANWGALLESSDAKGALAMYSRGCRGGSGIGCESQARLTEKLGEDSTAHFLNARRYHRIHCSQGYARSCHQLADLFEVGRGGPVMAEAAKSFRAQACSLGRSANCSP